MIKLVVAISKSSMYLYAIWNIKRITFMQIFDFPALGVPISKPFTLSNKNFIAFMDVLLHLLFMGRIYFVPLLCG